MKILAAYAVGLLFGVGIAISGMGNPAKVINFFDVFGNWDPSLMFVMGGALITTFIGYRLAWGKGTPLLEGAFQLPTKQDIDARLVGGSAVFGIGWGISGFCPGGALPVLGTGRWEVFVFTGALIAGILAAKFLQSGGLRGAGATA